MAPTVEECITLPNGMKMPRLALGTWKVFMILLSTLLILIDFCPVYSGFLTLSFVYQVFDILPEIIMEYQI